MNFVGKITERATRVGKKGGTDDHGRRSGERHEVFAYLSRTPLVTGRAQPEN